MKQKEKRILLARMVELYVHCGYDISGIVGQPLSYFNWELVEETVTRLQKEYDEQ